MKRKREAWDDPVVRSELREMSRRELTRAALIWRSYWVQWQDWADEIVKELQVKVPANVLLGRLGSQEAIRRSVRRLVRKKG